MSSSNFSIPGRSDGSSSLTQTPVMDAINISKSFGAVNALIEASTALYAGQVKAIVGDNGAGKSTFLKILSGLIQPDSGEIHFEGAPVKFEAPIEALNLGVQTVYQDLALIDTMTATQNVYVGREKLSNNPLLRTLRIVDDKDMTSHAMEVLSELGIKIPSLKDTVRKMSGGQRQCLAIARAMLFGHKVIILDEPTAALGVHESAQVLAVINKLRERGLAVVLVSHNMQHVFEISDSVLVMRLGKSIATRLRKDSSTQEIVGLITGAIAP